MPPRPESPENLIRAKRILGYKLTLLCAYRGVPVSHLDREYFKSGQFIEKLRKSGIGGTIETTDHGRLARLLGVNISFLKSSNPCSYDDLVEACAGKENQIDSNPRGADQKLRQSYLEELNELGFVGFDEIIGFRAG